MVSKRNKKERITLSIAEYDNKEQPNIKIFDQDLV